MNLLDLLKRSQSTNIKKLSAGEGVFDEDDRIDDGETGTDGFETEGSEETIDETSDWTTEEGPTEETDDIDWGGQEDSDDDSWPEDDDMDTDPFDEGTDDTTDYDEELFGESDEEDGFTEIDIEDDETGDTEEETTTDDEGNPFDGEGNEDLDKEEPTTDDEGNTFDGEGNEDVDKEEPTTDDEGNPFDGEEDSDEESEEPTTDDEGNPFDGGEDSAEEEEKGSESSNPFDTSDDESGDEGDAENDEEGVEEPEPDFNDEDLESRITPLIPKSFKTLYTVQKDNLETMKNGYNNKDINILIDLYSKNLMLMREFMKSLSSYDYPTRIEKFVRFRKVGIDLIEEYKKIIDVVNKK